VPLWPQYKHDLDNKRNPVDREVLLKRKTIRLDKRYSIKQCRHRATPGVK
jgi:hypothetical protein